MWNLKAGCKVNLYLDITGVRDNGYHEIASLFYPLPWPCDHIHIEKGGTGLSLSCSVSNLEARANILWRTYEYFADKTGFAPDIKVFLQKNIPMGAGLGGGSSNAAEFLAWLNQHAGSQGLGPEKLNALALSLGADVPFFLQNTPAWVTGIGEVVEPVAYDVGAEAILVVCAPITINTGWAYTQWDRLHAEGALQRKGLTLQNRTTKSPCFTKPPILWNCFEEIICSQFPLLYNIKQDVLACHAKACVMSGSGPSLVALFHDPGQAATCARRLQLRACRCFITQNSLPLLFDDQGLGLNVHAKCVQ